MTIKKIEIHGLNPEHPISQVIDEINDNLDAVIDAINSIEGGQGVVGPTGAKGDKGDTGQQGDQGPAGKDGIDGEDGTPGIQGEQGIQGERGLPGKDGINGLPGKDGLPGATGLKGDTGAQGIQGLPGKDGVGIVSATVTNGNLIITKTDGTTVDAGRVVANVTSTTTTTTSSPPVVGGAINPTVPVIISAPPGYAAGFVNAGQFVQLDNLKFSLTTGGQRGLCCATVTGTATLAISASYAMLGGGVAGTATNWATMPTYTTTVSGSWFGWSFPNAGDTSTYNIQDVTNKRFYRVTLMIGPGYNSNFISVERLF